MFCEWASDCALTEATEMRDVYVQGMRNRLRYVRGWLTRSEMGKERKKERKRDGIKIGDAWWRWGKRAAYYPDVVRV
jgi:hypothetical protein